MTEPTLTFPLDNAVLDSDIFTATWDPGDVDKIQWGVAAGSSLHGQEYFYKRILDRDATSWIITGLPLDGSLVYFDLSYKTPSGPWVAVASYTYTASDGSNGVGTYISINDDEYTEWLFDSTRNPYRTLLIELEHSAGTVYLSSLPWLDVSVLPSQPYDNWLIAEPDIEDNLVSFAGIGDVDAINPMDEEDWLSYTWRGYPCRWYFGDVGWVRGDFRQIASTLIDGIRLLDARQFRFDLMDAGQHLHRRFASAAAYTNISAKSSVKDVLEQSGLPNATYYNVEQSLRDYRVNVDVDEDTYLDEILRTITDSIGAYIRLSQAGKVEVFIPDTTGTPEITLTDDDIAHGQIQLVDTTRVYKTVRLKLADGSTVEDDTNSPTGELDEVLEIDTLLYRTEDITPALAYYVNYYSVKHFVYQLGVLNYTNLIQKGDFLGVDSEELVKQGVVNRVRRAPLSAFSTVEITV